MWRADALDQLAATPLTLRPDHIARVYELPPIHSDPFDRALIAQAMVEDLALVTADEGWLWWVDYRSFSRFSRS